MRYRSGSSRRNGHALPAGPWDDLCRHVPWCTYGLGGEGVRWHLPVVDRSVEDHRNVVKQDASVRRCEPTVLEMTIPGADRGRLDRGKRAAPETGYTCRRNSRSIRSRVTSFDVAAASQSSA